MTRNVYRKEYTWTFNHYLDTEHLYALLKIYKLTLKLITEKHL